LLDPLVLPVRDILIAGPAGSTSCAVDWGVAPEL